MLSPTRPAEKQAAPPCPTKIRLCPVPQKWTKFAMLNGAKKKSMLMTGKQADLRNSWVILLTAWQTLNPSHSALK